MEKQASGWIGILEENSDGRESIKWKRLTMLRNGDVKSEPRVSHDALLAIVLRVSHKKTPKDSLERGTRSSSEVLRRALHE